MNKTEAIEIMCRRCMNHEACQGTGCEPKRVLMDCDKEIFSAGLREGRNAAIMEQCNHDAAVRMAYDQGVKTGAGELYRRIIKFYESMVWPYMVDKDITEEYEKLMNEIGEGDEE